MPSNALVIAATTSRLVSRTNHQSSNETWLVDPYGRDQIQTTIDNNAVPELVHFGIERKKGGTERKEARKERRERRGKHYYTRSLYYESNIIERSFSASDKSNSWMCVNAA